MKTMMLAVLCVCSLLAGDLHAQKIEGKDAPDFSMGGVVNQYGPVTKADMAGDVIVFKIWGIT